MLAKRGFGRQFKFKITTYFCRSGLKRKGSFGLDFETAELRRRFAIVEGQNYLHSLGGDMNLQALNQLGLSLLINVN